MKENKNDKIDDQLIHQKTKKIYSLEISDEKFQGNTITENLNQENLNQENLNQENLNQENLNQENLNQENMNQENMNQENMNQENMNQENMNQENMNQGNMNQGNMNQEYMNQGNMNQGNMNQEYMNQGNMNQGNMNLFYNSNKKTIVFDKNDELNTFSKKTLKNQLFDNFFNNSIKLSKNIFDLQLKWLVFIFIIVFMILFMTISSTRFELQYPNPHDNFLLMAVVMSTTIYPMLFIFLIFNSMSIIQMREGNSIKRYFTAGIPRIQIIFIDVVLTSIYAFLIEMFLLFVGIPIMAAIVNSSETTYRAKIDFKFNLILNSIDWAIFLPSIIFGNIFFAIVSFFLGNKINSSKNVQFLGSFLLIYTLIFTYLGTMTVDQNPIFIDPKGEHTIWPIVVFKYFAFLNPLTIVTEIVSLSGNSHFNSASYNGEAIYYTLFSLSIVFSIVSVILNGIYSEKIVNLSIGR